MSVTKEQVLEALNRVQLPNGETLISRNMIRAVSINEGVVQFVIGSEPRSGCSDGTCAKSC